jgi:DNA-binding CsgD family transcriptional regulator
MTGLSRSFGASGAADRPLLSASRDGRLVWSTPQAAGLLALGLPRAEGTAVLPPEIMAIAFSEGGKEGAATARIEKPGGPPLDVAFVGRLSADEYLFRLVTTMGQGTDASLRATYSLTAREVDVLKWIACGKSNRDIGEILGLSPRTVNKHLEQIYVKLGVENRASAAVMASRMLGPRWQG